MDIKIDGFLKTLIIKCSFFDEHFTNHITTKDKLNPLNQSQFRKLSAEELDVMKTINYKERL